MSTYRRPVEIMGQQLVHPTESHARKEGCEVMYRVRYGDCGGGGGRGGM